MDEINEFMRQFQDQMNQMKAIGVAMEIITKLVAIIETYGVDGADDSAAQDDPRWAEILNAIVKYGDERVMDSMRG